MILGSTPNVSTHVSTNGIAQGRFRVGLGKKGCLRKKQRPRDDDRASTSTYSSVRQSQTNEGFPRGDYSTQTIRCALDNLDPRK